MDQWLAVLNMAISLRFSVKQRISRPRVTALTSP